MDFNKLTDSSKLVIKQAHSIARECAHVAIEPQVLMVAIIQKGNDLITYLFQQMDVDKIRFCEHIAESINEIARSDNDAPNFSPTCLSILEEAGAVAGRMGDSFISIEHLFFALKRVPNIVSYIMDEFHITENKMDEAIASYKGNQTALPGTPDEQHENRIFLNKYARNLCRLASEGLIEPVIGREEEIRRILQILTRKTKNNPILIGQPGTGKTAIVEGLAFRILRGDIPESLKQTQIYSLDLSSLIAGAGAQGEFEERLNGIVKEVVDSDGKVILFIDEIHLLVGAGQGAGAMDAANIIKPELARGLMKTIGATTTDEYRKYIEKDKALERRFQPITIEEPDIESAISILRGVKTRLESYHKVRILDEAVTFSVLLSNRYITDRFLPDKAVDLLDEAAAKMRLERESVPEELDLLDRKIKLLEVEKEALKREHNPQIQEVDLELANLYEKKNLLSAKWHNEKNIIESIQGKRNRIEELLIEEENKKNGGLYTEVLNIKNEITQIRSEVDALIEQLNEIQADTSIVKEAIDRDCVMNIIALWTGIPVKQMSVDETQKLIHLESELHKRIVGQEKAITAVSNVIRRNKAGLSDPNKPIGSFIFLGSTGVGKTELCKALAEYLFNNQDMMIRIDMSEYQSEYSVSRLFGAPPGYVGYDQGGQLTEAVKRKPYSVVLFDEIEKAHNKVFETLLQVLDDGRMTDGQGRTVNFKNTIIIMTSNIGGQDIQRMIDSESCVDTDIETAKQHALNEMRRRMSPEFINRIDETILFLPLSKEEIKQVVNIQLNSLAKKQKNNGIDLKFSDTAIDFLSEKGYQPEYGARPVKRAINEYLINDLSLELLSGRIDKDSPILVEEKEGKLHFFN